MYGTWQLNVLSLNIYSVLLDYFFSQRKFFSFCNFFSVFTSFYRKWKISSRTTSDLQHFALYFSCDNKMKIKIISTINGDGLSAFLLSGQQIMFEVGIKILKNSRFSEVGLCSGPVLWALFIWLFSGAYPEIFRGGFWIFLYGFVWFWDFFS